MIVEPRVWARAPRRHRRNGHAHAQPRVTGLAATALGGPRWRLTVTTDRSAGWVWWFFDGALHSVTAARELVAAVSGTVHIEALATRSAARDQTQLGRVPRTRQRTLEWLKSTDDVDEYHLEWATGAVGDTWARFATVTSTGQWAYQHKTPVLADGTTYRFRVVPVKAGNRGTAAAWPAREIVRYPDTPAWTATFDEGTERVTFSED